MFNSSRNFFELVRMDFLIDEDFNPHITEVNMSPNVVPSSLKGEFYSSTRENVVYNAVKLVGPSNYLDLMSM